MATPYTTGGFWQTPMTVWYDSDLSSIYAGAYGGAEYLKAGYIVLGVQQWGGKSETSVQGTTTQTQTLPVAFTDASYQVVRCVNNTSASNTSIHTNGFGVLSKATTSYTYRYPSVHTGWSHQWIAIGR